MTILDILNDHVNKVTHTLLSINFNDCDILLGYCNITNTYYIGSSCPCVKRYQRVVCSKCELCYPSYFKDVNGMCDNCNSKYINCFKCGMNISRLGNCHSWCSICNDCHDDIIWCNSCLKYHRSSNVCKLCNNCHSCDSDHLKHCVDCLCCHESDINLCPHCDKCLEFHGSKYNYCNECQRCHKLDFIYCAKCDRCNNVDHNLFGICNTYSSDFNHDYYDSPNCLICGEFHIDECKYIFCIWCDKFNDKSQYHEYCDRCEKCVNTPHVYDRYNKKCIRR